jgi:hypothetical protein
MVLRTLDDDNLGIISTSLEIDEMQPSHSTNKLPSLPGKKVQDPAVSRDSVLQGTC